MSYTLKKIFNQTASKTVANTVTETTLVNTAVGLVTIPANTLKVGSTLEFRIWGFHSSTGNPTITIRIKLGGTTICTMTGTSGNGTNNTFLVQGDLIIRTVGGTGTVFGQSLYKEIHSTGLEAGSNNTTTSTIDTTGSLAIDVTAEWGAADAGNTITCTHLLVKLA